MKAVIYTNYDNRERPYDSIKQQLMDCEDYAADNRLDVVDQYLDIFPGCMERGGGRPGLEQLLEDSKKQEFDIVIVAEMSHLSRCYFEKAICLKKLQENGVTVRPARDFPYDCCYPVEECYKMAFDQGRDFF